ncbi:hypothetical protein [Promicromonospora sp. NPDC050880]|uniref:hypothetical protein n=1 Tax=Promicromonospora sp. NPDC050880 TaxID=3364406 RepID=UPI00378BB21F
MTSTAVPATRAQALCRSAFVVTLLVFLGLAATLVAVQLLGVVLLRPDWVSGASQALLVPAITAGVVFGLVGFVGSYLTPGTGDD